MAARASSAGVSLTCAGVSASSADSRLFSARSSFSRAASRSRSARSSFSRAASRSFSARSSFTCSFVSSPSSSDCTSSLYILAFMMTSSRACGESAARSHSFSSWA